MTLTLDDNVPKLFFFFTDTAAKTNLIFDNYKPTLFN